MGNCSFRSEALDQIENSNYPSSYKILIATMSKSNFVFHYVIGRGGFGKVFNLIQTIFLFRFGELKRRKQANYML